MDRDREGYLKRATATLWGGRFFTTRYVNVETRVCAYTAWRSL